MPEDQRFVTRGLEGHMRGTGISFNVYRSALRSWVILKAVDPKGRESEAVTVCRRAEIDYEPAKN